MAVSAQVRQRHANMCEFKVSLVYIVNFRTARGWKVWHHHHNNNNKNNKEVMICFLGPYYVHPFLNFLFAYSLTRQIWWNPLCRCRNRLEFAQSQFCGKEESLYLPLRMRLRHGREAENPNLDKVFHHGLGSLRFSETRDSWLFYSEAQGIDSLEAVNLGFAASGSLVGVLFPAVDTVGYMGSYKVRSCTLGPVSLLGAL